MQWLLEEKAKQADYQSKLDAAKDRLQQISVRCKVI